MRTLIILLLVLVVGAASAQPYTVYDKQYVTTKPDLAITVFEQELNPDGSQATNNSIFCGTDGVLYFKDNAGDVIDILNDDIGAAFTGEEFEIAYGASDGGLTGEVTLSYDPVANYLSSFNYKTLRVSGMETQLRSGTERPLSFNSNVSGTQVANLFSYVNSAGGSDDITGIIGYRRFSAGPHPTLEGFFLSTRSFGGGPGFGNHSMFIGYNTVDLNGRNLTGLATPSADNSAATKLYVDNAVSGSGFDYTQTQDILSNGFAYRNSAGSAMQLLPTDDEISFNSTGALNDWKFNAARMVMPLTTDDQTDDYSFWLRTVDETVGLRKIRPRIRIPGDYDPGNPPGIIPVSSTRLITARDVDHEFSRVNTSTSFSGTSTTQFQELSAYGKGAGLYRVTWHVFFSSTNASSALQYRFDFTNQDATQSGTIAANGNLTAWPSTGQFLTVNGANQTRVIRLTGYVRFSADGSRMRTFLGGNGSGNLDVIAGYLKMEKIND